MVVKTSGSIYKEFLSYKTSITKENGVDKAHEGPISHQDAPRCLVCTSWVPSVVSYFGNFSNIPKWTKDIFMEFIELVYLPYHIPIPFQGSGAF